MNKTKKDIHATIKKELPEFFDEVQSISNEQLEARLCSLVKDSQVIQEEKDNDDDLSKAKEEVKNLAFSYKDAAKSIKLKTTYIISLLRDRGSK